MRLGMAVSIGAIFVVIAGLAAFLAAGALSTYNNPLMVSLSELSPVLAACALALLAAVAGAFAVVLWGWRR